MARVIVCYDNNNDEILDIAHTSGEHGYEYGLGFYINNGGSLTLMNENDFAYMSQSKFREGRIMAWEIN